MANLIEEEEKRDHSEAEAIAEEAEVGPRHPTGWKRGLIPLVAASWSLFQLALADFLLMDSTFVRSIHLAFAIFLVYLSFPAIKKARWAFKLGEKAPKVFGFLTERNFIPWPDILLGLLAAGSALYIMIDYEGVAARQGLPIMRDIVFGLSLVVLLLEAARRSLGLALPTIASLFILYSFFSEHMPSVVAFKNASFSKLVNKLTMSTEGIFGVPLEVSASTVFLFVLFGVMLDRAGGGRYFIHLAFSLLGRFKGGPGQAAVLASGLTGMISGSSIANTVTTGTFTIPLMKKAGYPGVKAGAIEVAASTNGQLMPPIMGAAAFIIAEYCNISYFEVVKAAFIPAVISYIALIFITRIEASKLNLRPIPKSELPRFRETFMSGLHFLIPLGFLIYQLMIVRRSPQLSAYYAILALGAIMILKPQWDAFKDKSLNRVSEFKKSLFQIWESLVGGGRAMMSIAVAVAAAGIVVGVVTLGLGGVVTELIGIISGGSLIVMLIVTAIVSLILGMGLPTTANYIVMATLTAPVIVELGGNMGLVVPLIAAHLFVFYFGILADDTPPVGLAAYAAAAISKEDPIKTGIQGFLYDIRTAILPFMFIFNTDLLLIGVEGVWQILLIFITGVIAMFAFASLTQNYFLLKNRIHESLLLALTTLVLLRPGLFDAYTPLARNTWYAVGIGLYATVILLQGFRRSQSRNSGHSGTGSQLAS